MYHIESDLIDQDLDGLPDTWEVDKALDPFDAEGVNGAAGDPDDNGYSNYEKDLAGTNPQTPGER